MLCRAVSLFLVLIQLDIIRLRHDMLMFVEIHSCTCFSICPFCGCKDLKDTSLVI
jgi:hypothetical protein